MPVDKLTTTFSEKSFEIVVVVGLGMVLPRTPVKLITDGAICVSTDSDASNTYAFGCLYTSHKAILMQEKW